MKPLTPCKFGIHCERTVQLHPVPVLQHTMERRATSPDSNTRRSVDLVTPSRSFQCGGYRGPRGKQKLDTLEVSGTVGPHDADVYESFSHRFSRRV